MCGWLRESRTAAPGCNARPLIPDRSRSRPGSSRWPACRAGILQQHAEIEQRLRIGAAGVDSIDLLGQFELASLVQKAPTIDARLDVGVIQLQTALVQSDGALRIGILKSCGCSNNCCDCGAPAAAGRSITCSVPSVTRTSSASSIAGIALPLALAFAHAHGIAYARSDRPDSGACSGRRRRRSRSERVCGDWTGARRTAPSRSHHQQVLEREAICAPRPAMRGDELLPDERAHDARDSPTSRSMSAMEYSCMVSDARRNLQARELLRAGALRSARLGPCAVELLLLLAAQARLSADIRSMTLPRRRAAALRTARSACLLLFSGSPPRRAP